MLFFILPLNPLKGTCEHSYQSCLMWFEEGHADYYDCYDVYRSILVARKIILILIIIKICVPFFEKTWGPCRARRVVWFEFKFLFYYGYFVLKAAWPRIGFAAKFSWPFYFLRTITIGKFIFNSAFFPIPRKTKASQPMLMSFTGIDQSSQPSFLSN